MALEEVAEVTSMPILVHKAEAEELLMDTTCLLAREAMAAVHPPTLGRRVLPHTNNHPSKCNGRPAIRP